MPSLPSAALGSNWLGDEQSYGIHGSSGRVRVSRHLAGAPARAHGSKFLIYLVCAPNKSYAIASWLVISIRPSINTRTSVSLLCIQEAWNRMKRVVCAHMCATAWEEKSWVMSVALTRRGEMKANVYIIQQSNITKYNFRP